MNPRIITGLGLLLTALAIEAQPTAFTYQGRLNDGPALAAGTYDLTFALYDASTNGTASAVLTNSATSVVDGLFTVTLDFGTGVFNGSNYWLEIGVRTNGGSDFRILTPRQPITSAPYAIQAGRALVADLALVGTSLLTNYTGPVEDSQLSTNVALLSSNATFAGSVTATNFAGGGAGLTNVPGAVPWRVVADTNVLATPNAGFLFTNDAEVTVTLPTTPSVGDVVNLCGSGSNFWRIAQTAGQTVRSGGGFTKYGGWTARTTPVQYWSCVASSADGTKLVAGMSSQPYSVSTSSDSGATWSLRLSGQTAWNAVASSADGSKLIAGGSNSLLTSTDAGLSWLSSPFVQYWWRAVAASADGSKMYAAGQGPGFYYSPNAGADWFIRSGSPTLTAFACSADGSKLVGCSSAPYIYTSTNSGLNWSTRNYLSLAAAAVTTSTDGVRLAAVGNGFAILTSSDSGVTWVSQNSGQRNWTGIASSADGQRLAACVTGGLIYTSSDAGVTWMPHNSGSRNWSAIACSADGMKLVATVNGGSIYTYQFTSTSSTTPGPTGYLLCPPNAVVNLLYTGGGKWIVNSSSATLFAN